MLFIWLETEMLCYDFRNLPGFLWKMSKIRGIILRFSPQKGGWMKKKDDPIQDIGSEQQRLLKNLQLEINDAQDLLKLVAASQDPESVGRDQMEFLGVVGSRVLNAQELKLAEKGISIDDLRKICGRKMEATQQRNNSLRDSLPPSHMLRIVYAEHDLTLYFLYDLMNLVITLYKSTGWVASRKDCEKIIHITGHLCHMDAHQTREEQIIGPQLAVHKCADLPKLIFGEHKRLHKHRVELKKYVDQIEQVEFEKWLKNFGEVVQTFVPATREHIYKEEHILYPEAMKIIDDPRVWDEMRDACDNIGLCCF
jgi:uncharacterized protein